MIKRKKELGIQPRWYRPDLGLPTDIPYCHFMGKAWGYLLLLFTNEMGVNYHEFTLFQRNWAREWQSIKCSLIPFFKDFSIKGFLICHIKCIRKAGLKITSMTCNYQFHAGPHCTSCWWNDHNKLAYMCLTSEEISIKGTVLLSL